jgi:hypothetical protein
LPDNIGPGLRSELFAEHCCTLLSGLFDRCFAVVSAVVFCERKRCALAL